MVGIEPSCILSFRDEYPDLVGDDLKEEALRLGKNCLLYDEFFTRRFVPEEYGQNNLLINR
ncbi:MAG: hypothetical protein ACLU4J_06460 [Butyricimonas paravirosa]